MLRNLERSGGVVLSEAVMMALAEKIGRDRAHALVLEISRDALARKVRFLEAVAAHPEVRRRRSPRRLASALEYRNSLGLAAEFVDRVVAAHQAERRRRRRPRR
jgi:adenylosuccinate lyase